jgi:phosphate uptake regulator
MKRKLVKQGAATLMVSLPAKWLQKFNLGKGDEINLEETDTEIVISKEGKSAKRKAEIKLTKEVATGIRTTIINAYRAGYDVLTINFENQKQLEIIKDTVNRFLLGYDIIKTKKDYCIIESITDPSPEQFDTLMRKIFFNTKEVIESTKQRLKGAKSAVDYEEIALRIYQYDSFCRRVVAKKQKDIKEPHLFWTFQTLLVHGQRELYHLNRFLDKNKVNVSKQTLGLMDDLEGIFELLMEGFIKKKVGNFEEIHKREKNLTYVKSYSLLINKKGKEEIAVHHIMSSIRNFYLASSPLIGMLLGEKIAEK